MNKNIRLDLWTNTLRLIINKPLFGYGATTFPIIYYAFNPIPITYIKEQHTHNMLLQIAYDYGIPAALAITIFYNFFIL